MNLSINIPLEGNEGPAMRLGILFTRIERSEMIESYPISDFEKVRLEEIMKHFPACMWSITKADDYWYFFNARIIAEQSLN